MSKVPNILDHLFYMAEKATKEQDRVVLMEAQSLCAQYFVLKSVPPSWPLNLDEWEVHPGNTATDGDGWWMMGSPTMKVRRRK